MDPKSLSNLDPKLRETYERVMGSTPATATGVSATTPTVSPTLSVAPPPTIPTPSDTHATEPTLSSPPLPVTPAAADSNPFQTPVIPTNEPAPLPSPASVNQMTDPGVSPVIRILYIAGAVVFFLVYTFFWVKVFNLQLPF